MIVNWLYDIIYIPFHKRHIIGKKDCIYWFTALGIHLIPCSHLHSNQVDENAVFDPLLHLHPSFRLMDVISMHIWRLIIYIVLEVIRLLFIPIDIKTSQVMNTIWPTLFACFCGTMRPQKWNKLTTPKSNTLLADASRFLSRVCNEI